MYVWFDLLLSINTHGTIKHFHFHGIFVNHIKIGSVPVYDIKWFSLNYIKKKAKFLSTK